MNRFAILALALVGCGDNVEGACDPEAPNTICTIAGFTLELGYEGDGGQATDATLYIPMESVVRPDGHIWFIDFNNYVVREIDLDGTIKTVIGTGDLGDSPASEGVDTVHALTSKNNHTPTMMLTPDYLYLAAWHESRIKRVRLDDMMMELYAGRGVRTKYDGDGALAGDAGLELPSSVAMDPSGNIVLTDQGNQVIRRISATTGNIETIAGQCVIERLSCTVNETEPVPCADSNKLTCGDPATSCGGGCSKSFGGDNGPALLAQLSFPDTQAADPVGRIAYDHEGNLLIADTGNNRIRKVDTTGIITTIAGTGTAGANGDGGPATAAELNRPIDLAIADDNSIYFTDEYNNCVRKIDPAGVITTAAGICDATVREFSGDGGDPTAARLNHPYGIDLAGTKLYISDSYNNRLRVVNLP